MFMGGDGEIITLDVVNISRDPNKGVGGNFLGLYSFIVDAYWAKFIGSRTKVNRLHISVRFQDKILT
jgi:hypothetical protein